MRKLKNKANGFGLVEILVSMVALGFIVFAASDLLIHTFNNTSKTEVLSTVQQNGQVVLNSFTSQLHQASSVVCVTDDNGYPNAATLNVLVVQIGDQYVRFRIVPQSAAGASNNGYIEEDYPQVNYQPSNHVDPTDTNNFPLSINRICSFDPAAGFAENSKQYLTDTNINTGVSVDNGYFQVSGDYLTANPTNLPVVKIYFVLKQGVNAGTRQEDSVGSGIPFLTSVQLR